MISNRGTLGKQSYFVNFKVTCLLHSRVYLGLLSKGS